MEPAGTSATSHKELASPPAIREPDLIGSILQLLGLDLPVPDHSTLSRRAETLKAPRPRSGSEPVHLLVDSTGLL